MKILHVLSSNKYSGAENVACQIIRLCSDENHEFIYCSPNGEIKNQLKERNITFAPVSSLSKKELRRIISKTEPDIIHAHDRNATYVCALSCKGIPLISHIHGKFDDMKKISLKNIIYTCSAIKADKIICVSNSIYNEWNFSRFFKNKILLKRNVVEIDVDKYSHIDIRYDVCFVGRLAYEKNIPRLLKILDELVLKKRNAQIVICGDGEYKNYLLEFIEDNNLLNNIDYKGFVTKPLEYIAKSKLMIKTSRTEGTPMSALESLTLGKPIVSTPTDGLNELITNNINGFLSNDDEQFISYIFDLLNDEIKYKAIQKTTIETSKVINNVNEYKLSMITMYDAIKKGHEHNIKE